MRGFSAAVELIRIGLQIIADFLRHKREQERAIEDASIRENPSDAWAARFGRVHAPATTNPDAEQLPTADTGTTGSGRRWDGEPGPE